MASWLEIAWQEEAVRKIYEFGETATYKRVSTTAYSTATATATLAAADTVVPCLLEEVRDYGGGRDSYARGENPLAQTRKQRYQLIVPATALAFDPERGDRVTVGGLNYAVIEGQKDGMTSAGVIKVIILERA